jgi:glycosyltransferase involved in cell wall biosynthesis
MTAGFYSPLPPARTGVADYSAALLAELRRRGPVELAPPHCDAPLYHLGNNALHAAIYRRALQQPGVIVLHDATLHHFLLGQLDQAAYVEEFVYNYGEWNRGLAGELWRGRAAAAADPHYFEYSMLRRALERARAVVVHNPAAARIVRTCLAGAAEARVVEIPHLFAPPDPLPSLAGAERYRQRLGIEPGVFLLGMFGFLRESRRLIPALEAFAELRSRNSRMALLVAGEFVSSDLRRAAAPLLASPGVLRLPYLEEREFWLAASAVDACVNLRDPGAGETSGIAIRLMGLGKPVLVTEGEAWARFPEGAFLPVARGAAERESLREHLRLLTSVAEARAAVGARAAAHIRALHGVDQAGERYWELLLDSRS